MLHMRFSIPLLLAALFISFTLPSPMQAQSSPPATQSKIDPSHIDSDGDGLSDALEQSLLVQFAPNFMMHPADCSGVPADFVPGLSTPKVQAENATIYGQVFPAKLSQESAPLVEIHYYDLWRRDCGPHGHPLDTEHVSVLVRASSPDLSSAKWKALYWFASAHQDTVCDVSQIARASTLHAQEHGATVWISAGKHASFLNQALCRHGCGSDVCEDVRPVVISKIINLGEVGKPMNGSIWIASPQWPLAVKMSRTDFPQAPIDRLNALPTTEIAWFNPGRHPAQGVIAVSGSTAGALGTSEGNTVDAISVAGDSTGNALQKSYRNTMHALGTSAKNTEKFLDPNAKGNPPAQTSHPE
jgi:hypothetical protein